MIVRVVILAFSTGNDAARAAIAAPWCLDRVFMVIATLLPGKTLLEVAEDDAVAGMGKRPARLDQGERLPDFARQIGQVNGVNRNIFVANAETECASDRQPEDDQEAQPVFHGTLGRADFDLGFNFLTQADV